MCRCKSLTRADDLRIDPNVSYFQPLDRAALFAYPQWGLVSDEEAEGESWHSLSSSNQVFDFQSLGT
jgi:hypothetical protein